MFCRKILRLGAMLCLFSSPFHSLHAQLGSSGSVSGIARATDGSQVSGAKITVSRPDGFSRPTISAPDGVFSFVNLPSGTYTVQSTASGFAPSTQLLVPVAVGRNTQLIVTLAVAGTQETVSVTATQSSFDSSQTSSVINIDRDRVEELPIPNRNYLSFVALSPQAVPANPSFSARTLAQSSGGFGFGGLRPSSNAVRIDGVGDDDEYTGSSRTQLSPEAINDFQIVNHGFSAESGGGAGGSIDVQTRSGLNQAHGDAFVFLQNGALNGTPPLEFTSYKPDENRVRAGLAIGGVLQRDRTFYYVAAEQEIAHGQDTNDLRPATLTQINSATQQPGPLHGLTLQSGFFPTSDQETELSVRLDRNLTTSQALMLRYAFTNTRNVNDAFNNDDLSDRTARGSSFISDNSFNGTLSSTVSTAILNKFSFELAQRRAVERTGDATSPGALIPGVVLFGTPYEGNNRRFETHLEFEDGLLVQKKRHLLQAGAGLDFVRLRSQVLDGQHGLFVFPTLAALTAGAPDFYTQSFFNNPSVNFAEQRINGYVQDHWTPIRGLAIDYGLRYDYNRLPSSLPQHPLNFSPRLGLAWTPIPSLILRSGFGIFYDRYLLSTINRLFELDGVQGFTQIIEDAAATALYRSGINLTQPHATMAPSIWKPQPGLHNPYSEVASFSIEQALPLQTTLKGEYQYVHGVHLGRTSNTNLLPPVVLTTQNAASLGVSFPAPQQLGRPVFSPQRANPAYDAINQFATSANSTYSGATVTLNRQFTDDFQILAGYTYSKTIDDGSFDLEQPQNPFALQDERALSLQDQRHRLTLSGLWLIGPDLNDPQDAAANANPGTLMRLLTGLEFAPIFSVTSGFRANPITGLDSNREHVYPFAARPQGYWRNGLSTSPNINLDFRVLKIVPIRTGHLDIVAESFNLLNHPNISLLNPAFGSGTAAQPGFGRPVGASTARRLQLSLDYEF
jgi:hypothetical protein